MTAPGVTGRSRLCFVIGDPVLHMRTPQALSARCAARGVDAIAMPLHVAASELSVVLASCRSMQNLNGLVVTLPHKIAAAPLCDELSPRAKVAGAVNVIRRERDGRLSGDLMDGVGFVRALRNADLPLRDASAYVAGAGGVARAIAFALAAEGVGRIGIANRTEQRAHELVERLRQVFPKIDARHVERNARDYALVVNATSLGLRPDDELPVDAESLDPQMVVAEVVMQPQVTKLLRLASEIGCRIQPGEAMLTGQLDLLADFLGLSQPSA